MMDPYRSLTRRILATYDARSGINPARVPPRKPAPPASRPKPAAARNPAVPRTSTLDHLAGLVGNDGATRLVAVFGGTRLYVPQAPAPDDALSASIGFPAATALAEIYGGDRIDIPNPTPRRVRIVELRASGLSIDAIALALHCTRRRVFQVMAEARAVTLAPASVTRRVRHPPAR
jgi:hypothetical protein